MRRRPLAALFALLAALVFAASAQAAVITPTRFDDPSGPGSCPSDCSLRQAIAFAQSGDTVQLQTGTYSLGQGIQLTLPNGKDLTINGNGASSSKVDANNDDRVFELPGGTASTDRLANLTIQHGKGSGGEAGGISIFTGTVTLDGVTVTNNTGTSNGGQNAGGGVQVGTNGTLVMTNSTVSNNIANNGTHPANGGGIFNAGTATITNTTISGNHADAGLGGGVGTAVPGTGSPVTTLNNDVIANNVAGNGGGVDEDSGRVTITNSVVEGNSARSGAGLCDEGGGEIDVSGTSVRNNVVSQAGFIGEGGGAVEEGGGKLIFTASSITGNTAEFGAGVSEDDGGVVSATDTTIAGNHAQTNPLDMTSFAVAENGGGGGVGEDGGGTVNVVRSTISSNIADARGGGIQAAGGSTAFSVVDSTIAHNSAGSGGGGVRVDFGDTVNLLNDTVSGNSSQGGGDLGICDVVQSESGTNPCDGHIGVENTVVSGGTPVNCATSGGNDISIDSHGHNLDSGNTCGFNQAGDIRNTDPQLGALASNGGPTQTEALAAGSPAVNAGDNGVCGNASGMSGPNDQRDAGFPRVVGAACDIGAFEVQASNGSPPVNPVTGSATRPTIHVSGVPRACVRSAFKVTVTITSAVPLTAVKVTRDGRKLKTKRTSRQKVKLKAGRPGRHHFTVTARNSGGSASKRIAFVRCATRPQPRHAPAPRFTG